MRRVTAVGVASAAVADALPLTCAHAQSGSESIEMETNKHPNIVVILADDLGWGDVSFQGTDGCVPTPHIDRLASEGMVFANAYAPSAVCSPSRYGLLTGRYPWRTWLQEGVLHITDPALIRPGRVTLPSMLRQKGYATYGVGKWHLGIDWAPVEGGAADWPIGQIMRYRRQAVMDERIDYTKEALVGPREAGFDYYYGTVGQGVCGCVIENNRRLIGEATRDDNHDDLFVEKASSLLRDHVQAQPDRPFLLYLALGSPWHALGRPERVTGKSRDGHRGDRCLWADDSVRAVLELIGELGCADNTIVIFSSDNGAWDNRRVADGNPEHKPNGPYRGFKTCVWEGGYRVPFVVRWPRRVKAGARSDQLVCLTDVVATIADVVGYELPRWAGEDSFSVASELAGEPSVSPRDHLVYQSYTGNLCLRDLRWKLVLGTTGSGGHQGQVPGWTGNVTGWDRIAAIEVGQCYDLAADPYELTDLFQLEPEVVAQMRERLESLVLEARSRP